MNSSDQLLAGKLEAATTAILMLLVRQQQAREDDEEEAHSIEGLLYRAGFTKQADIVAITGTSKSAVSRRLRAEGLT